MQRIMMRHMKDNQEGIIRAVKANGEMGRMNWINGLIRVRAVFIIPRAIPSGMPNRAAR